MSNQNDMNLKDGTTSSKRTPKETRLFSRTQVSVVTFFGTPIAGAILMARNFKALEKPESARNSIINGILGTIVLILMGVFLPKWFPDLVLPAASIIAIQIWYTRTQKKAYDQHIKAGGLSGPATPVVVIGIIGFAVSAILAILMTFPPDEIRESISKIRDRALDGNSMEEKIIYEAKRDNLSAHEGLSNAITYGEKGAVDYFLEQGAGINGAEDEYFTPLTMCAIVYSPEMTSYILDKGADINGLCSEGSTALMYAIKSLDSYNDEHDQSLEVIDILLSNGADVNINNEEGHTALMYAIVSGTEAENRVKLVQDLVDHGADVNATSNLGENPLWLAVELMYYDVVGALLEGGVDVNTKNKDGKTLIRICLDSYNRELAKPLLQQGIDLKGLSIKEKNTLLGYASFAGLTSAVERLLNSGLSINAETYSGYGITSLMQACQGGQLETAKYLINKGANINAASDIKITPLMFAIDNQHFELAKILIEKGANVNAADESGAGVLIWAIDEDSYEVTKLLISKGADVNAKTNSGTTALQWAKDIGNEEIEKLLLDSGATE
ncbi:ankyrin repeat domain-containing protein [Bacteroidota bacterium]